MVGLYWEDWEIGKEYVSPSRTITEADIVHFAGISGDYNPLHINEEHCKKNNLWDTDCTWSACLLDCSWLALSVAFI